MLQSPFFIKGIKNFHLLNLNNKIIHVFRTFCYTDPIAREEKVMDGKMIIGMNKHREICTLQMTGNMLLNKEQVLRCTNIATVKIVELNDVLQNALSADEEARFQLTKFTK